MKRETNLSKPFCLGNSIDEHLLVEYKMPKVEARQHNLFGGDRQLKHHRIMQAFRVLNVRFRMTLPRPYPAPPGR
jgi:hypothetical protein